MRLTRKLPLSVLPVVLLGLAACAQLKQPPREIRHYTLEYVSPHIAETARLPVSLRVMPFQAASIFAGRQMIYRQADFRREAYIYHQWRIPPADMLTDLFVRDLRQNALFLAVAAPGQHFPVTYVLSGILNQFMEQDQGKHSSALLSLTLTLTSADPGAGTAGILLQKNYTYRRTLSEPPPLGLVHAMSLAMADFTTAAAHDIYTSLVRSLPTGHR